MHTLRFNPNSASTLFNPITHLYSSHLHVMANLINMNICNSNNDQHFQELAKKRGGKFTDRTGKHF